MGNWASDALAVDVENTIAAIEGFATVDLISTFGDLKCAAPDEIVSEVLRDPTRKGFDHLPLRKDGRIIGLFWRAQAVLQRDTSRRLQVSERMEALGETNIISSGASVLTFIETADHHPCRLVLRKTAIDGIVTISDLQRLPVRPVLFFLITHLELSMERKIREIFSDKADRSLELLSDDRQKRLDREWKRRCDQNLTIDRLVVTSISDKMKILKKRAILAFKDGAQEGELTRIVELRNCVMHADGYAPTAEKAQELARTVRLIRKMIASLQ